MRIGLEIRKEIDCVFVIIFCEFFLVRKLNKPWLLSSQLGLFFCKNRMMKLDEVRNILVKGMILVETAQAELDSLQPHSDEELEIKKNISDAIKTLIANQLILVDNIFQVQEIVEDGEVAENFDDIFTDYGRVN